MADEALIDKLYDIVNSITLLGGEQERTSITPGVLVADANPVDLPTGYIKIVNPRDGTYVPCLTINGLVVEDNDLVNTLFTRGTEPIALSQSANSPSNTLKVSEIWDSDFDAVAMQANADGDIGIGTATIPHGGVGMAKFAIDGANASAAGPHVQITIDSDDHPVRQGLNFSHDNIADSFDAYFDGANWKSSDIGSNFQIYKVSDELKIRYDSAIAQGANVTWNEGVSLNATGQFSVNQDIVHIGDTDTKIAFTDDDVEITVGNLSMLKLTEAVQDLITLGPGSGDVDIDFNGDMFLRGSDGFFGINTVSPGGILEILSSSTAKIQFFNGAIYATYVNDGTGADLVAARRDADSNAWLRLFAGGGAGASDFRVLQREGTFATDSGSVEHFRIVGISGNVGIGTSGPSAKLHVDQASTTAAIPPLYLDQADISEEMMQFETTIGTGNAIEAIGAKTLTTTHFIKVTLPGALTRYIPAGTIA